MDNEFTIEEFRRIIEKELASKGVRPPTFGGEKELAMFQQWLKGKEKLQKLVNHG